MGSASTDENLLSEFVGGRRAALGELARRYETALLGLASGILGGRRELAKDAVQETWIRVIRFGGQFNGRSSFKTWLYRIAVNQCRTLSSADRASRDLGEGPVDVADAGQDPGPEGNLIVVERDERLRREMARLPDDRCLVLLLCYHEGLTHSQASEILAIPVGTLKSRLNAALTELRSRLRPETDA